MKLSLPLLSLFALATLVPAQTQTLTTQTNGGTTLNGWAGANSWFFDINVTATNGIILTQIDTRLLAGTGTMDVYLTAPGQSFVPLFNTPAAWTLMGSAPMTIAATGMATGVLSTPFYLAPGTYGVCLHLINLQGTYSSPGSPPTIPLIYSDANLSIDCQQARLRNCTTTNAFTGGNSPIPRVPNLAVTYTTNVQIPNFTANVTRGATPLTVQFSDASFSGAPGGIIAWAWDFNGDNVVDSSLQNPTFTYTTCGDYTVSLTIVDSTGGYTETKPNFVQTDLVTANFSYQLTAPRTLQFTDLSAPTPASWQWDLDGDSVVDSTAQNPLFVYPATTFETTVTLTVQLACRAPVVLTRKIAVSQALETTFQGGLVTTTTATGGANMFDLTVTNPAGVVINAMHVNSNVLNGQPLTVNVWLNAVGYLNNQTVPGVWRQVATNNVTSLGGGGRTLVTFPNGIRLVPGTYGVAVEQVGASPVYTNLNGNRTFSNADLTLNAGLTMEAPVFSTGTVFLSRIWNGVIFYSTPNIAADAGYTFFGEGCAGTLGVPHNTAAVPPRLNTTCAVQLDNLQSGIAFFLIGFSKTSWPLGALPFDLGVFGAPGCFARVSNNSILLAINPPNNTATVNLPVPNLPGLLGMAFYTQALSVDTVNAAGFVTSDAAAAIIGR